MLSVANKPIMLSVIMLTVIMLGGVILSVVMLNVMAPSGQGVPNRKRDQYFPGSIFEA